MDASTSLLCPRVGQSLSRRARVETFGSVVLSPHPPLVHLRSSMQPSASTLSTSQGRQPDSVASKVCNSRLYCSHPFVALCTYKTLSSFLPLRRILRPLGAIASATGSPHYNILSTVFERLLQSRSIYSSLREVFC